MSQLVILNEQGEYGSHLEPIRLSFDDFSSVVTDEQTNEKLDDIIFNVTNDRNTSADLTNFIIKNVKIPIHDNFLIASSLVARTFINENERNTLAVDQNTAAKLQEIYQRHHNSGLMGKIFSNYSTDNAIDYLLRVSQYAVAILKDYYDKN